MIVRDNYHRGFFASWEEEVRFAGNCGASGPAADRSAYLWAKIYSRISFGGGSTVSLKTWGGMCQKSENNSSGFQFYQLQTK